MVLHRFRSRIERIRSTRKSAFLQPPGQHQFCIVKEPYCRYVLSVSSDLLLSHLNEPRLASIFMQRPEYFSHVVQLNEEQLAYFLPFFQKSADEYEKQPDFYTLQSIARSFRS